jgi:hypothetical protein
MRKIPRDAAKSEKRKNRRLGTEVARLFRRNGLKPNEEIRELRAVVIQPAVFDVEANGPFRRRKKSAAG